MHGCASWCRLEDDSQKFSEGVLAEDFVSEDLDFLQDIVFDGRCSPISIKFCLEDKVPCIKIMGRITFLDINNLAKFKRCDDEFSNAY